MITRANLFISDLARHWEEVQDPKQKQRFQRMVLPEGVPYDRTTQTFGTAVLSPIFSLSEAYKTSPTHLVAELRRSWQSLIVSIKEIHQFSYAN